MTAAADASEVPDGHRCRYALREGKGPRGGRRTWTVATCVACSASAETQDRRPGSYDAPMARLRLVIVAPVCPKPYVPADDARALTALAKAIERAALVLPPLEWIVEFAQGETDMDAAVQRAWDACGEPDALCALASACLPKSQPWPPRAATCHALDECGGEVTVDLAVDGLRVMLTGRRRYVAAGIRAHLPRVAWRPGAAS